MATPLLAVIFTIEDILEIRPSPEGEGMDRNKIIFVPSRTAGEPPSMAWWSQAVSL